MLEREGDRLLVQLDLVGLAPHPRVDRRPVALDAARGGGTERLQASVWRYRPMCPMK